MNLNQFLAIAKRSTYAKSGESGERKLTDGGREFTFQMKGFKYRDIYFGFNPFAGEEVVWQDEKPIWVMHYYGKVISERVNIDDVYVVLKAALSKVDEKLPFRGPLHFNQPPWHYFNSMVEDDDHFVGSEKILFFSTEVYRLFYHGGVVS